MGTTYRTYVIIPGSTVRSRVDELTLQEIKNLRSWWATINEIALVERTSLVVLACLLLMDSIRNSCKYFICTRVRRIQRKLLPKTHETIPFGNRFGWVRKITHWPGKLADTLIGRVVRGLIYYGDHFWCTFVHISRPFSEPVAFRGHRDIFVVSCRVKSACDIFYKIDPEVWLNMGRKRPFHIIPLPMWPLKHSLHLLGRQGRFHWEAKITSKRLIFQRNLFFPLVLILHVST